MKSWKLGSVRLRQIGSPANAVWQLDYIDPPDSNHRVRKSIKAVDLADAKRQALDRHRQLTDGKRDFERITIPAALEAAVLASDATPQSKQGYTTDARTFSNWAAGKGFRLWHQLTPPMVREYLQHLIGQNFSHRTLKGKLQIVKVASRLMSRDYDLRDVAALISVPREKVNPHKMEETARRKVLSHDDLAALLDFLKARRPHLYRPALLMAGCGLRVLETISLRECDVNLEAGILEVTETDDHRPKNVHSFRKLPLPPTVLAMLRETIRTLPVGDRTRQVFLNRKGNPWTLDAVCRSFKKAIRRCWKRTGIAALDGFQPHYLRASFSSTVLSQGVDSRVLKRFIGHTRGDTLGLFYESIGDDRLRQIPAVWERWFWQDSGMKNSETLLQTAESL